MSRYYGVLRVIRVRAPADAPEEQSRYPVGWLPEEGLVHLLTNRETTIGRALNNDVILMDPTISREHARLRVDSHGWRVINLTTQNVVRVNGQVVGRGEAHPLKPEDLLVLGSTTLQLIAPQPSPMDYTSIPDDMTDIYPVAQMSGKETATPTPGLPPGLVIEWGRPHTGPFPGWLFQKGPTDLPTPPESPTINLNEGRADNYRPTLATPFPQPPELELFPHAWDELEQESLIGPGVTMQFALPQKIGLKTRWLVAGIGLAILLSSAIITVVLNSIIGIEALAQDGFSSILAALTIPLLPVIGIFFLINFMDRYEREPWFLRLASFLWGAIIAIPPAFFIESNVDVVIQNILAPPGSSSVLRSLLQGLNAGITEETIKGLGLLLLFIILRDEFDNVTDGIVYGALVGAGFAMVENFSVFANNAGKFLLVLIVGRVILGWLGHSTFTVCIGIGLGYIRHTHSRWRQIFVPLMGYLIAVGLHSFFDFVTYQATAAVTTAPHNPTVGTYSLIAIICDYIPPFLAQMAILIVLIKGLAHEAAVIREFLAVEVSEGVVLVNEYALLQDSFLRTRDERRVLMTHGVRQWLRVKALYQTEIGLAFRKWHVSMGDKPKLGFRQPEDAYRRRIQRLRQEIIAAERQSLKRKQIAPAS